MLVLLNKVYMSWLQRLLDHSWYFVFTPHGDICGIESILKIICVFHISLQDNCHHVIFRPASYQHRPDYGPTSAAIGPPSAHYYLFPMTRAILMSPLGVSTAIRFSMQTMKHNPGKLKKIILFIKFAINDHNKRYHCTKHVRLHLLEVGSGPLT